MRDELYRRNLLRLLAALGIVSAQVQLLDNTLFDSIRNFGIADKLIMSGASYDAFVKAFGDKKDD